MKVHLLKYTEGGEELLAMAGFATRTEKPAAEVQASREGVERMINFAIEREHSSLLDFPYYILSIENVSRSFTHQWVRYRMAAHLQQSLRYMEVDPEGFDWFVTPPTILEEGPDAIIDYVESQQSAGMFYTKYLEQGIPKEDARFALPIGTKTHISSAFNAEEYLHIIEQRTCFDAQWEIRTAANAIMLAGMVVHPLLYKKAGPPCLTRGKCIGHEEGECKEKAAEIKDTLENLAQGLKPKFNELGTDEKLEIDLTDTLGYKTKKGVKERVWEQFDEDFSLDWNVKLVIHKNWRPP